MKSRTLKIILIILTVVLSFACFLGYPLYNWYRKTYDATFTILVFTVQSPMKGANLGVVKGAIKSCIPGGFLWLLFMAVFFYVLHKKPEGKISTYLSCFAPAVCGIGLIVLLILANKTLEFTDYIKFRYSETYFIEEHYVEPDVSKIKAKDKPRNLIYIYMESVETAYASEDVGGRQPDVNYIPNLTEIADENISFSNTDKLGGFYNCAHTGWTSAALFSTQSGVPFMTPVGGGGIWENFGALITIGDILADKGFKQEFICGSDAEFGGRRALFSTHGDAKIMDYPAAVDAGYVDEDHYVWWGFEDFMLYDIAQQELEELASGDQPFNLTLLTVDTHDDGGYICELCTDDYPVQIANVISCADRQVAEFVEWCSEQSWYDDTVIVIQGDHPARTKYLLEGIPANERTTYNCFINTVFDKSGVSFSNRAFVAMDMMPTVLTAIGFEVPGDRLGLGTDLFSDTQTLTEEYGFDYIDSELEKHSQWFLDNIVWGDMSE
ncbi:MAG: LTA synthase family protein [Lachnospiraceae bacterium]|nr:LTA synthase family protein [Lachnospiraceae bacterium]